MLTAHVRGISSSSQTLKLIADELVSQFIDATKPLGANEMVWVTPGLPMLLFILVGLIIALVFGDPRFRYDFAFCCSFILEEAVQ